MAADASFVPALLLDMFQLHVKCLNVNQLLLCSLPQPARLGKSYFCSALSARSSASFSRASASFCSLHFLVFRCSGTCCKAFHFFFHFAFLVFFQRSRVFLTSCCTCRYQLLICYVNMFSPSNTTVIMFLFATADSSCLY